MKIVVSLCSAAATLLGLGLLAMPAGADWLVTRDGSRIQTDGEWRVEGRRVLFTLPNGTLSALRLTEVDLDASRAATEEAKNPPEEVEEAAAKEPKPEPILILTNKNIPKASEADAPGQGDGDAGPGAPALRVVDWDLQPADGGVLLTGRLENGTSRLQSGIGLRVEVRSDEGEVLATATSTLTQNTLVAGGIANFSARFPGFDDLPGDPTFVIDSLESRQAAREARETGEAGESGADGEATDGREPQ